MQSSNDCFHGCFPAPFRGLPEQDNSIPKSSASTLTSFRYDFTIATASFFHPNTQFTNHESLASLEESFSNFNTAYPKFSATAQSDQIRAQEYHHLNLSNHVCLDYIGHGLFSYSQQQGYCPTDAISSSSTSFSLGKYYSSCPVPFFDLLYKSVNLNSQILYGCQESEFESVIRKRIMRFMNISEDDYSMVFTANQTSAFKLLAESYPFQANRNLVTVYDYENEAVEAMIDGSKKKGVRPMSAEFVWPSLRIRSGKLRKKVERKRKKRNRGLFVFPIHSRMTGARYSYQWMSIARENGWHVLLDACALGAKDMETLGLSFFQPDFLTCSFYKIFGENPSGFCCLFVKKSTAAVLQTSGPSVGIVNLVPAARPFHDHFLQQLVSSDMESTHPVSEPDLRKDDLSASNSSSGSISLQNRNGETSETQEIEEVQMKQNKWTLSEIKELDKPSGSAQLRATKSSFGEGSEIKFSCLDHADSLGHILIRSRNRYLVDWLVYAFMSLQHPRSDNGHPLVRIYGPKIMFDRGPAVAFNVFDWKGEKINPTLVQKLADRNNISISCGYLQHIWFSDMHDEERERVLETRTNKEDKKEGNKKTEKCSTGISVLTASLGFLTNFEDTYKLWAFVSRFLDADFVEKERWRYMALNRTTVEV